MVEYCLRCNAAIDSEALVCPYCAMIQSKSLRMVQEDFYVVYDHFINYGRVSNEACPYDVSEAVQLKREGKFVEANRYYKDLYFRRGILYTDMADWWHKTLASAGAVACALSILAHTMGEADKACGGYPSQNYLHLEHLILCVERDCNMSIEQYIRILSGNPSLQINESLIDIECGTGRFSSFVTDLKMNQPELYWQLRQC